MDTPEKKELSLTRRTSAQAKYWNIYKKDLYLLADQASAFTDKVLSRPFTAITRWEDAQGNSSMPRFYAVIHDAGQRDLAALLVENGLARIHGLPVESPEGIRGQNVIGMLKKLQQKAKEQNKGAWAFPRKK